MKNFSQSSVIPQYWSIRREQVLKNLARLSPRRTTERKK
jgi:hypothetical protein